MKIVIAGPAHSGKSVFESKLRALLPQQETQRIAAAPDGEGDWTQVLYSLDPEYAQQLRVKGRFTPEFVEWAVQAVRGSKSRFTFVDVGGVMSTENRRICSQADAMIIVSSKADKALEWVEFAKELRLRVLAVVQSTLDLRYKEYFLETPGEDWEVEGLAVNLDRQWYSGSKTLEKLAAHLLHVIPVSDDKVGNVITIRGIAKALGVTPEELNDSPEVLPAVSGLLRQFAALDASWLVDGFARQQLVCVVALALRENGVALADDKTIKGQVEIDICRLPQASGSGPLPWLVTEDFLGGTLIEFARHERVYLRAEQLNEIVPPATDISRPVFLSGGTANWALVQIVMAYLNAGVPAIFLNKPQQGAFVCVFSRDENTQLGTLLQGRVPNK